MAKRSASPQRVVFAAQTCAATNPNGLPVTLHAGQAWHATDPFVQARPELFTDLPPEVHGTPADDRQPTRSGVESATRAPGERRA